MWSRWVRPKTVSMESTVRSVKMNSFVPKYWKKKFVEIVENTCSLIWNSSKSDWWECWWRQNEFWSGLKYLNSSFPALCLRTQIAVEHWWEIVYQQWHFQGEKVECSWLRQPVWTYLLWTKRSRWEKLAAKNKNVTSLLKRKITNDILPTSGSGLRRIQVSCGVNAFKFGNHTTAFS